MTSRGHEGEVYMNLMKIGLFSFFFHRHERGEQSCHAARQKQVGAATSRLLGEEPYPAHIFTTADLQVGLQATLTP